MSLQPATTAKRVGTRRVVPSGETSGPRQQLADARCLCGAPLRLHFSGLVVGRGTRLSCTVARYLLETGR